MFFRFLLLILLAILPLSMSGQVVVDLQKGATKVRSKNLADYDHRPVSAKAFYTDSATYVENLRLAFNALAYDSLDEAEKRFEEALKMRPDSRANSVIEHNLGRIAWAKGQTGEAVKRFSAILKKNPDAYDVRTDRAKAYLELGNAEACIDDCDVLLALPALDSVRAERLFLRGAAEIDARRYPEACADLQEVLTDYPDRESAALLLIIATQRAGRANEALDRANLLIDQNPESVEARVLHAELESEAGRLEAARVDYDEAIRLAPERPDLYAARAKILAQLGKDALASRDLQTAAALSNKQAARSHK